MRTTELVERIVEAEAILVETHRLAREAELIDQKPNPTAHDLARLAHIAEMVEHNVVRMKEINRRTAPQVDRVSVARRHVRSWLERFLRGRR